MLCCPYIVCYIIGQPDVKITPWFKLVVEKFLATWWQNLNNLKPLYDHSTIHRMCE